MQYTYKKYRRHTVNTETKKRNAPLYSISRKENLENNGFISRTLKLPYSK